jgi:flavodoxin I
LILYATTSGSTRLVVGEMQRRLGPGVAEAYSLGDDAPPPPLAGRDLVILATPTYGFGECHSAWSARGPHLLAQLPQRATVALLCLGDARGHGRTFAGGLNGLEILLEPRSPRIVGQVSAGSYVFEASPALRGDRFNGLVLEYRRSRRDATVQALEWLDGLAAALEPPRLLPSREHHHAVQA